MADCGTVVILAAGQGKRTKIAGPKVLFPLCGRPMLGWVLDQALALSPARVLVVVGHGGERVEAWVKSQGLGDRVRCVVQEPQLGTGHALQVCTSELESRAGAAGDPDRVVVLYGDMPLLRPASLVALCAAQEGTEGGAALLTALVDEPRGFGRIVRGTDGALERIVEERDASDEERSIPEVNLGVYAFDREALLRALPALSSENAQGEYYLTDVAAAILAEKKSVRTVEIDEPDEAIGVNHLAHLAEARWALQERILEDHLAAGVLIEDPASTYIDHGVEIGAGTHVLPCTVIRSGVKIGEGCEVGPFTHLRVGTVLEDGAEVGNFTECKKAVVGSGAKAKHLSYLGDVRIGARSNIGAGTIFANYDGVEKHTATVGEKAFIGSGTIVVAPNTIGDGAMTGAGAVVTRNSDVAAGETWLGVPAKKRAPGPDSSQSGESGKPS